MSHIWMGKGAWCFNIKWTWMSHIHISHMNKSCHIWMSHVTHMYESHHMCSSHVPHKRDIPHVYGSGHMWMNHVTGINESCRKYEWVTLHIWMSHVTCEWVKSLIIESCLTYKWVTSHNDKSCHASTSHVTHMNETLTCEWVMSHIWMSHVT